MDAGASHLRQRHQQVDRWTRIRIHCGMDGRPFWSETGDDGGYPAGGIGAGRTRQHFHSGNVLHVLCLQRSWLRLRRTAAQSGTAFALVRQVAGKGNGDRLSWDWTGRSCIAVDLSFAGGTFRMASSAKAARYLDRGRRVSHGLLSTRPPCATIARAKPSFPVRDQRSVRKGSTVLAHRCQYVLDRGSQRNTTESEVVFGPGSALLARCCRADPVTGAHVQHGGKATRGMARRPLPHQVCDAFDLCIGSCRDSIPVPCSRIRSDVCIRSPVRHRAGRRLHDHSLDDRRDFWITDSGDSPGRDTHCGRGCRSGLAVAGRTFARRVGQLHHRIYAADSDSLAGSRHCRDSTEEGRSMNVNSIARVGSMHTVERFQAHLRSLGVTIPCDRELLSAPDSPLAEPIERGGIRTANRIAVQPMEGWDGTADGNPTENTLRRWQRFGRSGAKLVWGGEAVAVSHQGRASPNQLVAADHTKTGLERLRESLLSEHRRTTGSDDGLLIGLQLTHSGRFSRPNFPDRAEPRILYRHPILDGRASLLNDYPILSDAEIEQVIADFRRAARMAWELGFDFVDVKHCHGYLGHEFLSAHTREGKYGGSFANRTRFLRDVVDGIHASAPGLQIGVRLSAFDLVPFRPDPELSSPGKPGPGIPEDYQELMPYKFGFGVNENQPTEPDLHEPIQFLSLLKELGIRLVNLTAGSPYYNPHIQRPALYPPSDGYLPPEDPLIGVARQLNIARQLKRRFRNLILVGTAY